MNTQEKQRSIEDQIHDGATARGRQFVLPIHKRRKAVARDLSKAEMTGRRFFKCNLCLEKMKIPQAFVSEIQGPIPDSVILRDRYKNVWSVEVIRDGNDWYINKGWPEFYIQNSLEPTNFMAFEYRGGNLFDFVIYGEDACAKQGVGALKFKIKEGDHEEYEDKEKVHEKDDDDDDDDEDEDEDDEDYVQEKEEEDDEDEQVINISNKVKNVMCNRNLKEEDDEEKEQVKNNSKRIKPNSISKSSCRTAQIRRLSRGSTFGIGKVPSTRSYQKSSVPDCYGADIFKSGLAQRPENPYFVTRSRAVRRKSELYIPKDVIVDYHLKIPERFHLMDLQGRKWETKKRQWKDGRVWCIGGWKSLCNVNHIDKDDPCICEFLQGEGSGDMYILVRRLEDAAAR